MHTFAVADGKIPTNTEISSVRKMGTWRGKARDLSQMTACGGSGKSIRYSDTVHAVASVPDSLKIWFYGDKRHEAGKAFGCCVRVGDFASQMELVDEAGEMVTVANHESSRAVETARGSGR
jgi:hypothetical protein